VIPADASPYATGWGTVSSDFTQLSGLAGVVKPFRNNTGDGVDLHIDYDLGFARLTSITGFQNFARKEFNDWDATGLDYAGVYFDTGSNAVSQELRLASEGAGPLQWVTGLYYDSEHLHDAFISDLESSLGFAVDSSYRQQAQTWALFGQTSYQLTDKLKIIGGLRLEREVRKLLDYTTAAVADGAPIEGLGVFGADSRLADDEWSGRIEADYQLTPASLLYASISRGVKSGGFSAYNTVQTDQLAPFQPETLLAYETGFKAEFLQHTLRVDGAAYYYQYHDQQVQSAIETFAGPIGNIVNAPRSRIFGGELEAAWTPIPALEIDQTLGYKRAQFLDYTGLDAATGVVVDRNGQDEGWPKLNYSGAASYRWDFDNYRLTAAVDYSYRGELTPVLLGPTYDVAPYWLFNANLTLTPRNGPWSIGLWGRNIFDQRYDLTRNFFTTDSAGRFISVAAPGAPATYGVRVTLKY
jgi:outer membrane receptor protein involved in Fe transport